MPTPNNSILLGPSNAADTASRQVWVTTVAFEAFLQQLRTVLANPAPIKAMVRARVSAMLGPDFDGEPDEWIFNVCKVGRTAFGVPNAAEIAQLEAELLT